MILVRAHTFDQRVDAILTRLSAESDHQVACLIDETHGPVGCGPWTKITVTREACEAIGLFCPSDFAWRCGDYGLYLATIAFPSAAHFWMIEYDVSLWFSNLRSFFSRFDDGTDSVDFIAPYLGRRFPNWYWHRVAERRYKPVYGCLFPIVRVSARALTHLLATRRADSAQRSDTEWPNDEVFVACELVTNGFRCRDLNSFGPRVCTRQTLSFKQPVLLSDLERHSPDDMIHHPVLSDNDLKRKERMLQRQIARTGTIAQRVRRFISSWKWASIERLHAGSNQRFWR